jgi:hypothetical protein
MPGRLLTAYIGPLEEGLGADELIAGLVDAPAGLGRALGRLEASVLVADRGHEAAFPHCLAPAAKGLVYRLALGGQTDVGALHVSLYLGVDLRGGEDLLAALARLPEVALGLAVARERALYRLALLIYAPADPHVLVALDRLPRSRLRIAPAMARKGRGVRGRLRHFYNHPPVRG